MIESRTNLIE